MSRQFPSIGKFAFVLVAMALLVRAAIPSGWMPSGERVFEVKICAGIEMQTVWLDSEGKLHKADPSKKSHDGDEKQDCAFAGMASHAILDDAVGIALTHLDATKQTVLRPDGVSVGRGLAAPPPPATGPPILI